MHFSAKRGLAIAYVVCLSVRPSVRPSVTLVDCDDIQGGPAKVRPTYNNCNFLVAFECVDKIHWFLANVNCIQQEVV